MVCKREKQVPEDKKRQSIDARIDLKSLLVPSVLRNVVDRRLFIRHCGKAAGGFVVTATVGAVLGTVASAASLSNEELDRLARAYYGGREDLLMEQMRGFAAILGDLMQPLYGEKEATAVSEESVGRYERMLREDLPYIGGQENQLQNSLNAASMSMAFCLVMKEHDRPIDEAGRLQYQALDIAYSQMPVPADVKYDPDNVEDYCRQDAELAGFSQKRQYPYDWLCEFVGNTRGPYDYGLDYVECGNVKVCELYGIGQFAPYLCMLDNITFPWRGQGLSRTRTLAGGSARCDFRYRDDGVVELEEPFTAGKLKEWD